MCKDITRVILIIISFFFFFQVNFMITDSAVLNRHNRFQRHKRIAESDMALYRDLAQASGGQALEVTKSELPEATSIITETTSSSLVSQQTSYRCLVPWLVSGVSFVQFIPR